MTKTQKLAGLFMTTVAGELILTQVVNKYNFAV